MTGMTQTFNVGDRCKLCELSFNVMNFWAVFGNQLGGILLERKEPSYQ